MGRRSWRVAGILAIMIAVLSTAAPVQAGDAGKVRFVKEADTGFESFVRQPSTAEAEWMRTHFWRQKTYAPYFDSRTSWYPNAWTYRDLYAVYTDARDGVDAKQHPDWVLQNADGERLYIPWGCHGGTCPQYAADIGNPEFRAHWIARAKETLAAGYRGLFIDDVNLELAVSDGNGDNVAPIDPRTGQPMTLADWRRYVADFVEQIRREVLAAHPGLEIAHNPIWFAGHSDPSIQRQLLAADYINLERGVNDDFQAGNGQFALSTFLEQIDWLHAHGKGVILDSYASTKDAAEYNLAAYFLVSGERDGFRTNYRNTPDNWWAAYDVELGAPQGTRYLSGGLIRRDFEHGYALVNLPGGATRTLTLPADAKAPDGTPRTTVTLPAASGRVVLTSSAGTPPPDAGGGQDWGPGESADGQDSAGGDAGAGKDSAPGEAAGSTGGSGDRRAGHVERSADSARPSLRLWLRMRPLGQGARATARLGAVEAGGRVSAGGRVRLVLERRQSGRWTHVRSTVVSVERSAFRGLFGRLASGRYRIAALHMPTGTGAAGPQLTLR